jgi:RNA polymerase sigma-70 factor, ECF subfamily
MEAPIPFSTKVPSLFEQTMLPHLNAAHNLARWLLRQDQDAEDAVQEAYLRAYRAFARFRGGDGRAWLLTIVRNVCYSQLRQGRREIPVDAFDETQHGATDQLAEVNAQVWREIKSDQLQRSMEALPAEFREVLVLHEIEELAYKEIAAVLEIPLGTVMSRLAGARQKLQDELAALVRKESSHGL